jgi:nucleoside-diphosphate-sugar epimerase
VLGYIAPTVSAPAERPGFTCTPCYADQLLNGYIAGKKAAEEALFASYPTTGTALKPSFIYGNRHVTSSLSIPLHLVGAPWKALLAHVPQAKQASAIPFLGALFTPPVSVEAVAKAAVQAATDAAGGGGIIDVWDIAKQDE